MALNRGIVSGYWAVELIGDTDQLDQIVRILNSQFDPRVECQSPHAECALRSSEFDSLNTAEEVRDSGFRLINYLNGVTSLTSGCGKVRGGKILRVFDDGDVDVTVFGELRANLSNPTLVASGVLTNKDGTKNPPAKPTPTEAQIYIGRAIQDQDIADMLTFLGRADNWFDIYMTFEMVERVLARSKRVNKMKALLGNDAFKDYKNARRTANWYRHARSPKVTHPVTFEEACRIARHTVRVAFNASKDRNPI